MNNRSEPNRNLESQETTDPDSEATEIPKRVGIAAGMFFPVFIVLAVAAVIIIFFLVR
jgi:hypothetical protein